MDPHSVEAFSKDESSVSFLNTQSRLWKETVKLADVVPRAEAGEFDAIFYVGGHGRMFLFCVTSFSSLIKLLDSNVRSRHGPHIRRPHPNLRLGKQARRGGVPRAGRPPPCHRSLVGRGPSRKRRGDRVLQP